MRLATFRLLENWADAGSMDSKAQKPKVLVLDWRGARALHRAGSSRPRFQPHRFFRGSAPKTCRIAVLLLGCTETGERVVRSDHGQLQPTVLHLQAVTQGTKSPSFQHQAPLPGKALKTHHTQLPFPDLCPHQHLWMPLRPRPSLHFRGFILCPSKAALAC